MNMPAITDLDLPHLPLESAEFAANPWPFIETARRRHPWLGTSAFGYFVHGYHAAKDLLSMDDQLRASYDEFIAFYDVEGTPWARFMREQLLALSGPQHARIRRSVGDAFTPRNINRYIPQIRRVISALLDTWAPKGQFDFADFATYFPITVLCGLFGTPPEEIPMVQDALEAQVEFTTLNRDVTSKFLAGYDVLWNFCDQIIVEREKSGKDEGTLLDRLIAAKTSGDIDGTELRFLLMILFPAGFDTSKNMLTLTVHHMLARPDLWRRCAADAPFCHKVVEEMFRYHGVTTMFRTVAEPFEYDGVRFPTGAKIVFGNSLASRDPSTFSNPDTFDPERDHSERHIGFGRGVHLCLGQHLAKIQIAEGLHLITQRLTEPRLVGEVQWRPYLGVSGPRSLPLAFTPA
jgi:cytochrome P450